MSAIAPIRKKSRQFFVGEGLPKKQRLEKQYTIDGDPAYSINVKKRELLKPY
jgi:hypothetical protein